MGESRARARTDSPLEHNVEQNGKASAFTMAFAPGSAKTQGILPPSQVPRPQATRTCICQLPSRAIGDRRVRLLTVNLNADESKPGELRRARKGRCGADRRAREPRSQTRDGPSNYLLSV